MTKWILKTNGLYVKSGKEDTPQFHQAKLFNTEKQAERFAHANGVILSGVTKVLVCDICQRKIDNIYYESAEGSTMCEVCSEALMSVDDQLGEGVFVHHDQYKDVYLGDEISDLELFHRKEKGHA